MKKIILSGLLIVSCAAQAAGNPVPAKRANGQATAAPTLAPRGAVSDFLINYFATAGMNWAGSALMNAFGIQSQGQQELADLGVLVTDMNTVLTELSTIQSQLNTLLGDFNTLYQQVLSDQETQYGAYITILQNGVGTYWSDFQNNVPANATLQAIANDPAAVSGLQAEFNDTALNALYNDLTDMTDTQGTGFYGIMVSALNQKITAQVEEIEYGFGGGNIVPYLNGYNESLMNLYQSTMVSVQQSYVIFSTIAYLMANTADFSTITIPIPGVKSSNTYASNQSIINQYYQNLLFNQTAGSLGIFNLTSSAIYSDQFNNQGFALVDLSGVTQILWPLPLPETIQSQCTATPAQCQIYSSTYPEKYQPKPANGIPGMPLGYQPSGSNVQSWTSSCNLYVWQGVVPTQGMPWQGTVVVPTCTYDAQSGATQCTTSLGGGSMTAWCNGSGNYQSYTQDLSQASSLAGPWSFYYGPYANRSTYLGKLQPETYSTSWLQGQFKNVSFDNSFGFASTSMFDGMDPHNCAYIDDMGFSNPPGLIWLTDDSPSHDSCSSSGIYNVATARLPGGTFWSIWEYIGIDGLTSPVWIGGSLNFVGSNYTYLFQVQCNPSDPFCYQPVTYSNGNGVCVGGNQVTLIGKDSNSVNAQYYDGCGSSMGRAGPDSNG